MNKLTLLCLCLCLGCLFGCNGSRVVRTQYNELYHAHLSVLPIDRATFILLAGGGEAEAELAGSTLKITGSFAGLSSAASSAFLHKAAPGLRGPALMPLIITEKTAGDFDLTVALDQEQIQDLRQGFYYVQISTQANADGEIRGWLLPTGENHE